MKKWITRNWDYVEKLILLGLIGVLATTWLLLVIMIVKEIFDI